MGTDWKELANSAKSRSDVYGLLTRVFREEPTAAFINELRGPRLSRAFSDMDMVLGESFHKESEAELVEALVLEFTRLFIGPGPHISAHASVFNEAESGAGRHWGAKPVGVKNRLRPRVLSMSPDLQAFLTMSASNLSSCKNLRSGRLISGSRRIVRVQSIASRFSASFLRNTYCAGYRNFVMR